MCARNDFHILLFRILQVYLFATLIGFPLTTTEAESSNAIVATNYRTNVTGPACSSLVFLRWSTAERYGGENDNTIAPTGSLLHGTTKNVGRYEPRAVCLGTAVTAAVVVCKCCVMHVTRRRKMPKNSDDDGL